MMRCPCAHRMYTVRPTVRRPCVKRYGWCLVFLIVTVAVSHVFGPHLLGVTDEIVNADGPVHLMGKGIEHAGDERKSHHRQNGCVNQIVKQVDFVVHDNEDIGQPGPNSSQQGRFS